MLTLYTTHCPACTLQEKRLKEIGLPYETCENVDSMLSLGIKHVPVLADGDHLMSMKDALNYINSRGMHK